MKSVIDKLHLKTDLANLMHEGPKGLSTWQNRVDEVLKEVDLTEWNGAIKHGEELHLYSQIKNAPEQESYLF